MSARPDFKSKMNASLGKAAPPPAQPKSPIDDRFDLVEAEMSGRESGLLTPGRSFSAETSKQALTGTGLISVPIDKVLDNPLNARHVYDPEVVQRLASSLATHGQQVPAPAFPHPELPGHFTLVDGHYRKRGLLAANKKEILLQLTEALSGFEMYRRSFLLNEERNGQTALDNALAWKQLLDGGLAESADSIAEMLGISKANISKTLAFLELPSAALDKIRETPGKFGLALGYELTLCAKHVDEKGLLALIERVLEEDLSSRQVAAIRSLLTEARPPRKQKELSRIYRLHDADGHVYGALKDFDASGKVSFEIRFKDPAEREVLVEELRRRFRGKAAAEETTGAGD